MINIINVDQERIRYQLLVRIVDSRAVNEIAAARIEFDATLTTKGGSYCAGRIVLNPHADIEHQRQTLGHEIAHLLDDKLFSGGGCGDGHGVGWAFWMRKLGVPVEKFHDHAELIRRHTGAVYYSICLDCGQHGVTTFVPQRCIMRDCESGNVRVRRDGIGGGK